MSQLLGLRRAQRFKPGSDTLWALRLCRHNSGLLAAFAGFRRYVSMSRSSHSGNRASRVLSFGANDRAGSTVRQRTYGARCGNSYANIGIALQD